MDVNDLCLEFFISRQSFKEARTFVPRWMIDEIVMSLFSIVLFLLIH